MASYIGKYEKCQEISVSLIALRNIAKNTDRSSDDVAAELINLTHVRLDREQIHFIDNLDCLGPVTNLYLQKNEIRRIENLEVLPKLRFLTLADNKITKVENLRMLSKLQFLDLSNNQISHLDAEELPPSLLLLHLNGNPCTQQSLPNYRKKLLLALPALQQLDGEDITKEQRLEAGCPVESDEESDEEDEEENNSIEVKDGENEQGSLHQHYNDILVRAQVRTIQEEKEHEKRMKELARMRELRCQKTSSRASSRP